MLAVRKLSSGYADRVVLRPLDAEWKLGRVVALLGPNGSGKSTLLRTIAGLLKPLGGDVEIDGAPLESLSAPARARRLAFVPQSEEYRFAFTAREVVAMARVSMGGPYWESDHDWEVVDEALERCDCAEFAARPVAELSGGERQRVRLARALAQEAPIVLMDEPTNHLDYKHQVLVAQLLRTLAEREGKLILAALHDLNFATAACDEALLLHEGEGRLFAGMKNLCEGRELETAFQTSFARLTHGERTFTTPEFS